MGIVRVNAIPNAPEKAPSKPNSIDDAKRLNALTSPPITQLDTLNDPSTLSVYKIGLEVKCCAAASAAQITNTRMVHRMSTLSETAPRNTKSAGPIKSRK